MPGALKEIMKIIISTKAEAIADKKKTHHLDIIYFGDNMELEVRETSAYKW